MRALDRSYGPRKELLCANIEGQDMARTQLVEDTSQGGTIGSKEEELGPEAIGLLFIVVIILIRNKGGSVGARAHSWRSASIYLEEEANLVHDGSKEQDRGRDNSP